MLLRRALPLRVRGPLLALSAVVVLGGCETTFGSDTADTAEAAVEAAAPDTALAALGELAVKGRAPRTGYEREQFGAGWVDTDHNGCDTRNDVLARDLTGEAFEPGTQDCVVVSGTLADPYTGQVIEFRKGDGSSVDIDHVVALGNSWQTGSFAWDEAQIGRAHV